MDNKELHQKVISWMKEIFKDEKLKINSIDYNSNEGYVAEILFVDITLEENSKGNFNLVVKKGIDDSPLHVSFPDSYLNEIDVYSKFIPYLQKFEKQKKTVPFEQIPCCYGTIIKDDQKIIILDNLKMKGFRMNDIRKPLDVDHMSSVLKSYGEFHALSLALRDQESKKMEEFRRNWRGCADSKLFKSLVAVLQKELRFSISIYEQKDKNSHKKSHVIEKLKILEKQIKDLFTNSLRCKDENYWVLSHVDCWNNNYLFKYDEETKKPNAAVLLDWQLAVFASPLIDVTAVLFYCGSRNELEQMDYLLKVYYNSLSTKLKELGSDPEKCLPWEVFLSSFKRYVPIAIALMPICVKLRCEVENVPEAAESVKDELFLNGLCQGNLKEPEDFFKKIDEIFEFCIEKGFI